jgi:hypothetical protein
MSKCLCVNYELANKRKGMVLAEECFLKLDTKIAHKQFAVFHSKQINGK